MDVQKLNRSFVYNLWSWNSLYIGEEIYSLIGFLDWLAAGFLSAWPLVFWLVGFYCSLFAVFASLMVPFYIPPVYFLEPWFSFVQYIAFYR